MMAAQRLTLRQQRFVDEFVLCGNASEAARRAGYSEKTAGAIAAENLQKPVILEAIRGARAQNAARLDLTRRDVLSGVLAAIEMAKAKADPATMLAGYRDLARMCGFNEPEAVRVAVAGSGAAVMAAKFVAMSDAELIALASGGA